MKTDIRDLVVSAVGLAAIFNVTEQSVHLWVRVYGMPKLGRGRFRLVDCVRWRIEKIAGLANGEASLEDERRKLVIAQRHRAEIENRNLMAELLPVEDVSRLFNDLLTIFDAALDDLPASIAQQVAAADEPAAVQTVIDAATTATRRAAAAAVADLAHSYNGEAPATKPRKRKYNGGAKAA
jgi:phage terminase Nu1 subunit (DNA packaging protein)